MPATAKTLDALRHLKHDVCSRLVNVGHSMNSSNAATREVLEETFRIALYQQGVSVDGAWRGAEELIQCANPKVVRRWLAAYPKGAWFLIRQQALVEDAAHGHFIVKWKYEELRTLHWEQRRYAPIRYTPMQSLRTFQRRVRLERQLAQIVERILDREAKRRRAQQAERARMPSDASDLVARILDAAEAEGFSVVQPTPS